MNKHTFSKTKTMNKIKNDEKNINDQAFKEYSFLSYDDHLFYIILYDVDNKIKNDAIIKHINNGLIKLKDPINRKKILKTQILKRQSISLKKLSNSITNKKVKGVHICQFCQYPDLSRVACIDKVFDHSNIKTLTPKQMLQRSSIAFGQVKAGNSSENLLIEFRQIIYSLNQAKEITKDINSNRMNSIKL